MHKLKIYIFKTYQKLLETYLDELHRQSQFIKGVFFSFIIFRHAIYSAFLLFLFFSSFRCLLSLLVYKYLLHPFPFLRIYLLMNPSHLTSIFSQSGLCHLYHYGADQQVFLVFCISWKLAGESRDLIRVISERLQVVTLGNSSVVPQ